MSYPSDRLRFLPEVRVRIASVLLAAVVVVALAVFVPGAAGEASSSITIPAVAPAGDPILYDLQLIMRSSADRKRSVQTLVYARDGELILDHRAAITGAEPVHFSTAIGDTTFHIEMFYAPEDIPGEGQAVLGTLKVVRAGKVIYTTSAGRDRSPAARAAEREAVRSIPPDYSLIGEDVTPPRILKKVDATYTEDALKARVAGLVILEAWIDEQGVVRETKVLKGLPFGLDQTAAGAVKQWVFAPALRDGKPVAVVFNVTVKFDSD